MVGYKGQSQKIFRCSAGLLVSISADGLSADIASSSDINNSSA